MEEYQAIRFTLLNHKQASIHQILASLHFLIENRLMHKEWKRFENLLLSQYHEQMQSISLEEEQTEEEEAIYYHKQLLSLDSSSQLLSLFDKLRFSNKVPFIVTLHIILLEKVKNEMEVDDSMREEIRLYDEMLARQARQKLVETLEDSLQFLNGTEIVHTVLEWYNLFTGPSFYSPDSL